MCTRSIFYITVCCGAGALNLLSLSTRDRHVRTTEDVVYATGLTCQPANVNCTSIDLKLDVYEPDPNAGNFTGGAVSDDDGFRPGLLIVHGGANVGGDKRQGVYVGSATFWARRGFVVFVMNYRLKQQFGLYPRMPKLEGVSRDLLLWDPEWPSSYPVVRDVKAAIRFVRANRLKYRVDQDAIVITGGSAGAIAAVATGVVFESDFKDEFSLAEDPTLSTTHMNFSSAVHMVISHWGGTRDVRFAQHLDPERRSRYGVHNVPLLDFHGTLDNVVPISEFAGLATAYETYDIQFKSVLIDGAGHGAWCSQPDPRGPVCADIGPYKCQCKETHDNYCSALDEYTLPWVMTQLRILQEEKSNKLRNNTQ